MGLVGDTRGHRRRGGHGCVGSGLPSHGDQGDVPLDARASQRCEVLVPGPDASEQPHDHDGDPIEIGDGVDAVGMEPADAG